MTFRAQKFDPARERVVGFEMEYSPSFILQDPSNPKRFEPEPVDSEVFVDVIRKGHYHCNKGFLDNGFRAYLDSSLGEIGTAETHPDKVGMLQLVSEEMAIDALNGMAMPQEDTELYIDDTTEELLGYILPLRVASDTMSSGFHENYARQVIDTTLRDSNVDFLNLFAATIGSWTGQGLVSKNGNFLTTQKVKIRNAGLGHHVVTKSAGSAHNKPIPGTERYEFRRNNYPTLYWQLQHRAPYISAVIRAVEMGEFKPEISHVRDRQHDIALDTAYDPFEETGWLQNRSPVQWQLDVAVKVLALAEKHGFPDYETNSVREVLAVLNDLEDDDLTAVATKVPWVLKEKKIERSIPGYFDNENLSLDEVVQARKICIALDIRGLGGALEKIRGKDPTYKMEDVRDAKTGSSFRLPISVARGCAIAHAAESRSQDYPGAKFEAKWMSSKLTPL